MRIRLVPVGVAMMLLALASCSTAGPITEPEPTAATPAEESPAPPPTEPAEPSPEPSRVAAADLVVTTEGLGTLEIGVLVAADDRTGMIIFDEDHCALEGEEADASAARWVAHPDYTVVSSEFGEFSLFGVAVIDDVLERVDVFTPDIPTDSGIRIGAAVAEVRSAHPDVVAVPAGLTEVYVVPGARGELHIEVATDAEVSGYWDSGDLEIVQFIRAVSIGGEPFSIAASGNAPPFCL